MAEQGRIVMTTVEAAGNRGRLSGNQFHNTSYRASYGTSVTDTVRVNFTPHLGRPSATGFTANQRPAVYYQPSLDHIDNPQFGLQLSDNFMSQTKRHYQPHIRSDGWRSLPNVLNKPRESGFHQLRNHPKTETVEQKVEPRQTHNSVMKSDFMPPSFLQCLSVFAFEGTEATPSLRSHSSRETGFTRGTVTPLACPTSLLPSPQTKFNTPTKRKIGKKELSGFLLNAPNNQAFPNTPFDCSHFTTHYKSVRGIINSKMDNGYNRRDMDRFIFRG
ncbi:hypothetical protein PAMA_019486 [Pampus argenteus]